MKRYFSTALLGAALLLPVATVRADDDDHRDRDRRYYDTEHRDYHVWNNREDQAYRRYWRERNEDYRNWQRLNRDQQRDYWRWRHNHPDSDDMDRRTR